MNQGSFQAITAMVNAFPQASAAERKALLLTFEKGLGGVPDRAISETALRFIRNEIPHQSATFAPSVAEFVREARRVPIDDRPRLPPPEPEVRLSPAEKARMRLKMPMYRHAYECGLMDQLDAANRAGFSAMLALAGKWGIEIPADLLDMPADKTERQWQEARQRAWAEINRNPPPFLRQKRSQMKHPIAAE